MNKIKQFLRSWRLDFLLYRANRVEKAVDRMIESDIEEICIKIPIDLTRMDVATPNYAEFIDTQVGEPKDYTVDYVAYVTTVDGDEVSKWYYTPSTEVIDVKDILEEQLKRKAIEENAYWLEIGD